MRLFQKLIYYSCYYIYKIAVKISHPEVKYVWYRNSLCFDYWKFLKSDIDVTIVFERATKRLIEEISYTHSQFRRFFPIIGEMVIFSEDHKQTILNCANTYELQRDPFLVEKYSIERKGDYYEKIVFLHKFLVANWSKKDINTKRSEKINYYSQQLDLGKKGKLSDLIDDLSSLIGADQVQFKEDYIKQLEFDSIHYTFDFPNIIYCLFYNKLCYMKPKTELSIVEKKILEKAALWELWGCYSYQSLTPSIELQKHFKKLTTSLETLTDLEFSKNYIKMAKELGLINS